MVVEPFWLKEDLMTIPLTETDDLVFDGRTIPRATARNLPRIQRRTVNIAPDDLVRGGDRARNPAFDLAIDDRVGQHRKGFRRLVARLHLNRAPVDGAAVQAGRCSGLQPI